MSVIENTNSCQISYALIRQAMEGEPYTMQLAGNDGPIVEEAVNQGIDGHLEACFCPDRGDRFEWVGGKLHCIVSKASFPTLIRRLYEVEDEEGEAARLADDMLRVLGINEYGRLVGREALGLD
ncbi:MAG: hypothetical protein HYX68_14085 [Planctomycetes bacterium]|nr:hypothetical protein [Planctomycetota bacterium]